MDMLKKFACRVNLNLVSELFLDFGPESWIMI